jgi:hypothetical protein
MVNYDDLRENQVERLDVVCQNYCRHGHGNCDQNEDVNFDPHTLRLGRTEQQGTDSG